LSKHPLFPQTVRGQGGERGGRRGGVSSDLIELVDVVRENGIVAAAEGLKHQVGLVDCPARDGEKVLVDGLAPCITVRGWHSCNKTKDETHALVEALLSNRLRTTLAPFG